MGHGKSPLRLIRDRSHRERIPPVFLSSHRLFALLLCVPVFQPSPVPDFSLAYRITSRPRSWTFSGRMSLLRTGLLSDVQRDG